MTDSNPHVLGTRREADSTGQSVPAAEYYGPLTAGTLATAFTAHPGASVLCVAPNLQATAAALAKTVSVEPNDAPDVWYVDAENVVNLRREAQGSPPLSWKLEEPLRQTPVRVRQAPGVGMAGEVYAPRDDNDVCTNHFCKVVAGPDVGKYGVYWSTATLGADGWPETVVVKTCDANDENIVVNYSDIRPDVAGKR